MTPSNSMECSLTSPSRGTDGAGVILRPDHSAVKDPADLWNAAVRTHSQPVRFLKPPVPAPERHIRRNEVFRLKMLAQFALLRKPPSERSCASQFAFQGACAPGEIPAISALSDGVSREK